MGPRLCPAEARKRDVRATLFLCVRPLLERLLGAAAHLGNDNIASGGCARVDAELEFRC